MEATMSRVLSDDDLDRLAKLLGMTDSEHDGECLAAARMANKMRRELGLTWREVFVSAPSAPKQHINVTWQSWRTEVLACPDALTAWELGFAHDIGEYARLSPKQAQTLSRLLQKCRAFNARRPAAWAM
jgi:hypothetical protein